MGDGEATPRLPGTLAPVHIAAHETQEKVTFWGVHCPPAANAAECHRCPVWPRGRSTSVESRLSTLEYLSSTLEYLSPGRTHLPKPGGPPDPSFSQGRKLGLKPDTFLSYIEEIETPILVSPIKDNVHGNEQFPFHLRICFSSEQKSASSPRNIKLQADQTSGRAAICKPTQRNFRLGEVGHHSSRTLLWAKSKRFPSLSQPLSGT